MNEIKVIDRGLSVGIYVNGVPMVTTDQLAEAYGATPKMLRNNFNNNKDRYTEGKHFICLTGEELRSFKGKTSNLGFATNLNKLYLWTKRGALLHAKSLNTDKAWEVYERLVDFYFEAEEQAAAVPPVRENSAPLLTDPYIEQLVAAVRSLYSQGYRFYFDQWGLIPDDPETCLGFYSQGYVEVNVKPLNEELDRLYTSHIGRAALYQHLRYKNLIETYTDLRERSSVAYMVDARKDNKNLIQRTKGKYTYRVLRLFRDRLPYLEDMLSE